MTVATTTNRKNYVGNGVLDTFAYDFKIFAKTDLWVYVAGVLKTVDVDYSVTGVGEASGGNVVFVTPPASGASIVIIRELPLTQLYDYQEGDAFPAEAHESGLDRLIMIAQQYSEVLNRILKVPVTSLLTSVEVTEGAGKFLRWNAGGDSIDVVDLSYGDVGVITTKGDLVRGGTGGVPERFAKGSEGDCLTVLDGKPYWMTGIFNLMQNSSGGTISSCTVCVVDEANPVSFKLTTTQGDTRSIVIIPGISIAAGAWGLTMQVGKAVVAVQGNVAIGDFLRTSTTQGRAESAGTTMCKGVFAVATQAYTGGADGYVFAHLFGKTFHAIRRVVAFNIPGVAVEGSNITCSFIMPFACTITKAYAYARTAPTGADLIFDINKNGTSIWATTQANRIKIAAGANSGTQTSFDTTALAESDRLDIDIDQKGSTVAGADITVELRMEY